MAQNRGGGGKFITELKLDSQEMVTPFSPVAGSPTSRVTLYSLIALGVAYPQIFFCPLNGFGIRLCYIPATCRSLYYRRCHRSGKRLQSLSLLLKCKIKALLRLFCTPFLILFTFILSPFSNRFLSIPHQALERQALRLSAC